MHAILENDLHSQNFEVLVLFGIFKFLAEPFFYTELV